MSNSFAIFVINLSTSGIFPVSTISCLADIRVSYTAAADSAIFLNGLGNFGLFFNSADTKLLYGYTKGEVVFSIFSSLLANLSNSELNI
jgi:hypothetical protein